MSSNDLEIRSAAELRATDDNTLAGYAVRYNEPSGLIAGAFKEIILPGAFTRSLGEGRDIVALYQHDSAQVLGRISNGSLTIREDDNGLYFILKPNLETQLGRDVIGLVKRQDIKGMSFGMRVPRTGSRLDTSTTPVTRYVSEAEIGEISLVTLPAYPTTTVNVRHLMDGRFNQRAKLRLAAL